MYSDTVDLIDTYSYVCSELQIRMISLKISRNRANKFQTLPCVCILKRPSGKRKRLSKTTISSALKIVLIVLIKYLVMNLFYFRQYIEIQQIIRLLVNFSHGFYIIASFYYIIQTIGRLVPSIKGVLKMRKPTNVTASVIGLYWIVLWLKCSLHKCIAQNDPALSKKVKYAYQESPHSENTAYPRSENEKR
jgi:hypothetical protein